MIHLPRHLRSSATAVVLIAALLCQAPQARAGGYELDVIDPIHPLPGLVGHSAALDASLAALTLDLDDAPIPDDPDDDWTPVLFEDAGDPGFYATEPPLPETAILLDPSLTGRPQTPAAELLWKRFSGGFVDWTSRLSLGARYLAGNSNQNFIDFAADFEKKQELRSTQINLQGQFGESNGEVAANRWFANSTTDFYHGSKWMTFVKLMDQYDQLQNLNYRGTFSGGAGYRFLFDDQKRLVFRVGPGVTTEFFRAPTRNRTTPDLFGELELRLPVWARLKWEQKTIIFPSLSSLEVSRAQNQTALLYAFDDQERWSLKIGFQYQFISEPNTGRLPNDYTTNLSLVYLRK